MDYIKERYSIPDKNGYCSVSILVVMDYIKELANHQCRIQTAQVSILVVMDYIKERSSKTWTQRYMKRFNPCCDGLYKRTQIKIYDYGDQI